MHLSPKATVHCSDGYLGRAEQLIINPHSKRVSYILVKADGFGGEERLVPFSDIAKTQPDSITLTCNIAAFAKYQAFTESHFVETGLGSQGFDSVFEPTSGSFAPGLSGGYFDEKVLMPSGELGLESGTHVDATDGRVGRIDEFFVDKDTGVITHLIMRQGHVFGEKDVFVPLSDIEKIEDDCVYLKLSMQEVKKLKHITLNQIWREEG